MRFHLPTKIVFNPGSISNVKETIENELRCGTPLLVTDRGIIESKLAEPIISQFEDLRVFDEVEPNPKAPTVNKAGEIARDMDADVIIGLGGGSSMDAAKATALLATNEGKIEEYEGQNRYENPPLPVVSIPTTCGTGSEVTWVAVITDPTRQFKMSIKGTEMFPSIAMLDPDLLTTLP